MSTVRVVYFIDSLGGGGAEHSLAAMAPHLRAAGIDLTVGYLRARGGVEDQLREAGARLVSLEGGGGRMGHVLRARKLIRAERPDLVHTTLTEADIAGRVAARLAGVRVVSTLANEAYGPVQQQAFPGRLWRLRAMHAADAATATLVHRFHAISHHVATTMSRRLHIDPDRIDVIPRGRDRAVLGEPGGARRAVIRHALGFGNEPVVLAAAREEPQKGLELLVEAFATVRRHYPDARLVLAGRSGASSHAISAALDATGGAGVSRLGPRGDVPDLMCAADIVAIPSRWEGMGGTAVEALALEVPLVASDIPPLREVAEEAALFAPAGSVTGLAAALIESLRDPDAARGRAAAGRRRFETRFSIEGVAAAMAGFYRRCRPEPEAGAA